MWNQSMDNDYNTTETGGGFYGTNKFDSPGTDKKKDGTRKAQSITPVVISMINNCKEDDFTMWGFPVSIIKLVCICRKYDATSTTVTYHLEDHTGTMKAVLWLEHDNNSEEPNIPFKEVNSYVRVFGTLRTKNEEKVLMILKIAGIDSANEITTHQLEVINVRLISEKRSKGEEISIKQNNPGAQLSNSMMNYAGMETEEEGMTPTQKSVFQFMRGASNEVGVSRKSIQDNFPPNQRKDVDAAINFLVSEGHIFSTIDHDHFQLTTA